MEFIRIEAINGTDRAAFCCSGRAVNTIIGADIGFYIINTYYASQSARLDRTKDYFAFQTVIRKDTPF
jgi:hypothetical protein